jgi:hypothetical protein
MATWSDVVALGMQLPGSEESTSYGRPALKVRGKLYARLREEGGAITLRATFAERDALIAAAPDVFSVTDHYRNHEWVIINLETAPPPVLEELLTESWRRALPPKLRRELTAAGRLGR